MVSGCGIKPSTVKAPKDAETKIYPRTHPDLNTHSQTIIIYLNIKNKDLKS